MRHIRYVLHDRDSKFCASFDQILRSSGVHCVSLPPRSPNLNAFAERWVRSIKQECLSKLILFGESSLRRALDEYAANYHSERNHQGKGNLLLFPSVTTKKRINEAALVATVVPLDILTIGEPALTQEILR